MPRHTSNPIYAAPQAGDFILSGAAATGLGVALFNYLRPHNGIDGTLGALLVVASTVIVLVASLVLALFARRPSWRRVLLTGLVLFGLIGTVAAAYFLESTVLIAMMAFAFVGWVIRTKFAPNAGDVLMDDREGLAR